MNETHEIRRVVRQWIEGIAMRSMRDMTRYVKSTALSMPQFSLLMRLYYGGGCEVHDIGTQFDVSSAAASQLVDRLVQAGLVARTESPEDRRVRQIELSPKGKALVDKGIEQRYRWMDELVSVLSPQERSALLASIPILIEAEKRLPDGVPSNGIRHAIRSPRERSRE